MSHPESHRTESVGWLRAAVLGANDGLISVSSLIAGVAASNADQSGVIVAGIAGLVAGALSMAAGEYVSVSSQSDSENADLAREKWELENMPDVELDELTMIYQNRGLQPDLAREVAIQLTAHDALGTHAREELGIMEATRARPVQAALASAAAFAVGAGAPVLLAVLLPRNLLTVTMIPASMALLLVLGAVGGKLGGSSPVTGAVRVGFWGAMAMGLTSLVGKLFGTTV